MKQYKVKSVSELSGSIFLNEDSNGRIVNWYMVKNSTIVNDCSFYPEVNLYSYEDDSIYNLIEEKVMSLSKLDGNDFLNYSPPSSVELPVCDDLMFFFVYNMDNYYHFLYDSLPYLITYLELRKTRNIKLLVNYPNEQTKKMYKFVEEFLDILGIKESDVEFIQQKVIYKNIIVSDSYTHGIDSNLPPRNEIYNLYEDIANLVQPKNKNLPRKIYISRRSWKHNDYSNIGTNYTTRRCMTNETELVDYLQSNGYEEIFTELLDITEKISLFKNATHIVGTIGGGMANVLFSPKECKVVTICSPGFLDINKRFIYSMCNTNLYLYKDTSHTDDAEYLKYMRVKYKEIVGEIVDISEDKVTIAYLDKKVAGWNDSIKYKHISVNKSECEKLDTGLNSNWQMNFSNFIESNIV